MSCCLPRARALARVDELGAASRNRGNVSYTEVDRSEVDRGGGEKRAKEGIRHRIYRLVALLRFIKSLKKAWRSSLPLGSSTVSGLAGSGEDPYACRS